MIPIKTPDELDAMREAGRVAGTVLAEASAWVKPGVTTREIDEYAASRIKAYGVESAFLGYAVSGRKYPATFAFR